MEQFQRNMNMNVNIPPHPTTPPHKLHQNKGLTTLKVTSHKFLLVNHKKNPRPSKGRAPTSYIMTKIMTTPWILGGTLQEL